MDKLEQIKKEFISSIKDNDDETLSRINSELNDMEKSIGSNNETTLEDFYDIYNEWKNNNIPAGDVNEVNSMLAYQLGMTTKKPDGELIERRIFARPGFPDIDSDFDYFHRRDVYEYCINKYGREYAGNIGTYSGLKLKSTITRMGKVFDVAGAYEKGKDAYITENEEKVNEIKSPFPKKGIIKVYDVDGGEKIVKTIDEAVGYFPDFKYYMDKYPNVYTHSKKIEGVKSSFSVHAGGLVISNQPLKYIAPMRRARDKGKNQQVFATQYEAPDLESIGLIKYDFLAISTLTVIDKTIKMIKDRYGYEIDIKKIPLDDKKTFDLYKTGKLNGVFQCEQYGMQKTIEQIAPDRFEDIIAAIALYRPGPIKSIPEYCARKHNKKPVEYFHNSIESFVKPYLQRTYGILCYQEQVLQICNKLANLTITEGYILIKGISKKKESIINMYRKKFIQGCQDNKVPEEIAIQYWESFIMPFARYGFNLSHSCSYAYRSYLTAYLKANYPDEFICSYLNVEKDRKKLDKVEKLKMEATKNLNIKILKEDINKCKVDYTIVKKKDVKDNILQTEIMPSLVCEGIGIETAQNIEDNAPYENLKEFAIRTDSKLVNSKAVDALAKNGFFGAKAKKNKDAFVEKFTILRNDLKQAGRKGVVIENIFDQKY